jgi:amino acid permease
MSGVAMRFPGRIVRIEGIAIPVTSNRRAALLIRALSRGAVRMLAAVTVAYTLIAVITVLSRSEDVLAWIAIVSTVGVIVSFPIMLITRIRFASGAA